ncbi:MAG: phage infection protein [Bacteroidota bacterium]
MSDILAIVPPKADISLLINANVAIPLLNFNKSKVIILITKVTLDLENCYGIRKLKEDLEFGNNPVVAIYAPNGSMKSSLAQAFSDLSKDVVSKDRYFESRVTKRKITDQDGNDLTKEMILSLRPYDDKFAHTEGTSVLLLDEEKKKEYDSLHKEENDAKKEFLKSLKELSKSKKDLEKEISFTFNKDYDHFFDALIRVQNEVENQRGEPFSDIEYDRLFNDKVLAVIGKADVRSAIKEFVEKYNELLASSTYFKRGVFNYYDGGEIAKQLANHGFFEAKHYVTLKAGENKVITTKEELEQVIEDEKQKILTDSQLKKKFDALHKSLHANEDVRGFSDYITKTEKLWPYLDNLDKLKDDIWKSYFKNMINSYRSLIDLHKKNKKRSDQIEDEARRQNTLWGNAINTFNERFYVPFRLEATNHVNVMLGKEKLLNLGFTFIDDADSTPVSKELLLEGLSTGERKAFYILNIIFEVERRKKEKKETVFVVDDIADSFDYKNKYAIIEYLQEISAIPSFYQIILTHNFDFLRTIESRKVVKYDHCYMAYKSKDETTLKKAIGIRNPFINDWKGVFFTDPRKRIASIPFMRNLIEYTKGESDPDYIKLTSLLHWKPDTDNITNSDLAKIFNNLFGVNKIPADKDKKVCDSIDDEMKYCLTANEGVNFENKIVLSVGIRLRVDKFMIDKINDRTVTDVIEGNQTRVLANIYEKKFPNETHNIEIIHKVLLMTPENIHLNSFMYEPILDMSDEHLKTLCNEVCKLN